MSNNKKQNSINKIGKIYERPWGTYQTLALEKNYQVKRIIINSGGCLSLQKHLKRSEHWIIVSGHPIAIIGDQEKQLTPNEHVYIPIETIHCIKNTTNEPVIFIEVQYGSYLGEDDIIRLDDIYNRLEK